MTFDFLLIFFVLAFLRKSLKTRTLYPHWDMQFKVAMAISMFLYVAGLFYHAGAPVLIWIGKLGLVALVYMLYKFPIFKSARSIYLAILPYIIVSIVSTIIMQGFPKFYNKWESLFDSLQLFAILWGVGVWIVTRKQRKELAKAKEKMLEQEEKARMMTIMKDELEKQVAERTHELTKQNEALESALEELKATQNQLIQSEKMASLGELTAGIAHEIQNPLNFVNNFSEVSNELLDEMKDELSKNNRQSVNEIVDDIKQNLEKINFHGKRADAIVKGMLQHSRASTGIPEPTDINSLCDEYFRLAYHGLRAKDKTFNATMKMDFDQALNADATGNGKIKIIPQDIGRVLLNLLTNAFYEVHKKANQTRNTNTGAAYEPIVRMATRKLANAVEITVSDNGNGIPEDVLAKIFQPFFTTKPTGEGTGLGLSLSYDIITKGHGGDISVCTTSNGKTFYAVNGVVQADPNTLQENTRAEKTPGTVFKIELPIKL